MASAAPAAGGTASLADSNMASYYTKDVSASLKPLGSIFCCRPTSSNGLPPGLTPTVPASKQENRARKMELAKAEDEYDGAGAAPGLEVRRRRRKHGK